MKKALWLMWVVTCLHAAGFGQYIASNGLRINTDGNIMADMGGGAANVVTSWGFPLDSSGNLMVDCILGCSTGTISGVTAGTGLSGGGTSGNVTLTNAGVVSVTTSTTNSDGLTATPSATTGAGVKIEITGSAPVFSTSVATAILNDASQNLAVLGLSNAASDVDYFTMAGGLTTAGATLGTASGTDANVNLILAPKGTGQIITPAGSTTNPFLTGAQGGFFDTGFYWNGNSGLCFQSHGGSTSFCLGQLGSETKAAGVYSWSSGSLASGSTDTGLSRGSAGVVDVGTGASGSTAGFIKTSQTLQVITSNYTTTGTTLAGAGVVTGLNFTAPVSFASNWSFQCHILYSQATAAAADLFGFTTAGTAPTNLQVRGAVLTSQTGTQVDNNADITTATSTTVITATPGAFGAIGTNADIFQADFFGTLEAPSNASPTQVGFSVASGSASDALTVYRGSYCQWY